MPGLSRKLGVRFEQEPYLCLLNCPASLTNNNYMRKMDTPFMVFSIPSGIFKNILFLVYLFLLFYLMPLNITNIFTLFEQADDEVEWKVLKPQIYAAVMDFFATGLPVVMNEEKTQNGLGMFILYVV